MRTVFRRVVLEDFRRPVADSLLSKTKWVCSLFLVSVATLMPVQLCVAKDAGKIIKQHERNSISLELEFSQKNANALQRVISFLDWEPSGYATGFLVGNRLVLTAYHVVSGKIDPAKKLLLGFGRKDELEVKVFTNGCQAKVLHVDQQADLALLRICGTSKQPIPVSFQSTVAQDERLFLIGRPHGEKIIGRGTFSGAYIFNGIEYWSVKTNSRDGFSGGPVYNEQGQLVGVFSAYDSSRQLAVISPGARAQKLLEDFAATAKP